MGRSTSTVPTVTAADKSSKKMEHFEAIEQIIIPTQNNERIVFLSGDVNESSITQVINQILTMAHQNDKPINMIVSTYGGSVDEMFSLYDVIKSLPCPVHTIGLGKVMSAGVLLLSSGVKGKRLIGRSTRIMIHPISSMMGGNIFEMMNEASEIQRMQNLMIDAMISETSMSKEQLQKLMKSGHDNFLTPSEAINLGIADKIFGEHLTK